MLIFHDNESLNFLLGKLIIRLMMVLLKWLNSFDNLYVYVEVIYFNGNMYKLVNK